MIVQRAVLCLVLMSWCATSHALSLDEQLQLVEKIYALKPKMCQAEATSGLTAQEAAGKALFSSTILSGNRDVSCETCHFDALGGADGLPMAVGTGGYGEGKERYVNGRGALVQRNAFSLRGRAHPEFTAYFWDGRVQQIGDQRVAPFGAEANARFDSLLAMAAVLPVMERDELLGAKAWLSRNDLQRSVEDKLYMARYKAVSQALRARFLAPQNADDRALATLIRTSGVSVESLELADIGNLLAAFIATHFDCRISAWDRYLAGDRDALTPTQKRGAVLFFGKGRCATCHSGPFQSDFDFHSIGVPQGEFGPQSRHRDIGRAAVTSDGHQLLMFRTPPLNGVKDTAPYGHNGAFPTLREAVTHHFNPLAFYQARKDYYQADYYQIGAILASRDRLLSGINLRTDDELEVLIAFLTVL